MKKLPVFITLLALLLQPCLPTNSSAIALDSVDLQMT